jgi:hypothetical protein
VKWDKIHSILFHFIIIFQIQTNIVIFHFAPLNSIIFHRSRTSPSSVEREETLPKVPRVFSITGFANFEGKWELDQICTRILQSPTTNTLVSLPFFRISMVCFPISHSFIPLFQFQLSLSLSRSPFFYSSAYNIATGNVTSDDQPPPAPTVSHKRRRPLRPQQSHHNHQKNEVDDDPSSMSHHDYILKRR